MQGNNNLATMLNNRPQFETDIKVIECVIAKLATVSQERSEFFENPTAYLQKNGIPVSHCKLPQGELAGTSEVFVMAAVIVTAVGIYISVAAWVAITMGIAIHMVATVNTAAWANTSIGGACFLPKTPVNTKDGKYIAIENINVGDKVLSLDEKSRKLKYKNVSNIYKTRQPIYYIINNKIKATANHPFFVDGIWKSVKYIKVGDKLLDKNLKTVIVEKIDIIENPTSVYNLTVEDTHTYFVHDVLVHNKREQGDTGSVWDLGSYGTLV